MVKILDSLSKKKYYSLIISPQKVVLIEIIYKHDSFITTNKISIEENVFKEREINKYSLIKCLVEIREQIHKKTGDLTAIVVANLPIFFVQSFILQASETIDLKDAIVNKIKQELPINLNKYIWDYSHSPLLKNKIFVSFYNKDDIIEITNALIENKILPLSITHILYPIFDFIKTNFSLYYDNSYQFYILNNDVLTSATYEVGMLQNIYCEIIKENVEPILKRLIENNIRNSKLPLDAIYISSDKDLEFDEEIIKKYKIININQITNLSTEEIASINLIENYALKKKEAPYELKVVDLSKEKFAYELMGSLKVSIIGLALLFAIMNLSVFSLFKLIDISNQHLKNNTVTVKEEISFEDIKNLTSILQQYNSAYEPFIEKVEKIFYNLKDYNITQGYFTREGGKILIEEENSEKRNQIKQNIEKSFQNVNINLLYNGLEINFNKF